MVGYSETGNLIVVGEESLLHSKCAGRGLSACLPKSSSIPFRNKAHHIPRLVEFLREFPMIASRPASPALSLITNRKAVLSLCLAQCVLLSLCALAQQSTIISFDPPESRQTIPLSINRAGSVTGYYSDGSAIHGFLRAPDGSFTIFDASGSVATYGWSINRAGSIAGYFSDGQMFHGLLRTPDGSFIAFDPPGSTWTVALAINPAGAITGYYGDANGLYHGFLRAPDGAITSFDPAGSTLTRPVSINSSGMITGYYTDSATQTYHAFVRAPDGTLTIFDVQAGENTEPAEINSTGEITGQYGPLNNPTGFLRAADGAITTFAPVKNNYGVVPGGINDEGKITGASTLTCAASPTVLCDATMARL